MWTLEHNTTNQSLALWGLNNDLQLTRSSQSVDVVTVSAPALADSALLFDADLPVSERHTVTIRNGSTIWFQGKAGTPTRIGSGDNERIQYVINGPWFDFERTVFQQQWKYFYGKNPAIPPAGTEGVDWEHDALGNYFVIAKSSELFLGQTYNGLKQNTGAQITEALNWAITCGSDFAVGTIDPAVNIPINECRDTTVAEVIRQMLRWSPDATTWFDYSTVPPCCPRWSSDSSEPTLPATALGTRLLNRSTRSHRWEPRLAP
jgi:hypothetical protein